MEYTKEQLIGLKFKQSNNEYTIFEDLNNGINGLKFENKLNKPDGYYTNGSYNTKLINTWIRDGTITLITNPNQEPTYEIY